MDGPLERLSIEISGYNAFNEISRLPDERVETGT